MFDDHRFTADRPGPGECYAECVAVLNDLLANPGRKPLEPWLSYKQELDLARQQVAELEPVKDLAQWPDDTSYGK